MSLCTWFSPLYVHLACLLHVLFSKMASPSCDHLMWLSRRIPAAFMMGCNIQQGQCWGSGLLWRFPQNSASFIFQMVSPSLPRISPGMQQWLNCQSWVTAATQTKNQTNNLQEKHPVLSNQIPNFRKNYLHTKAYANFWVKNMVFCHSGLPKPSIFWIT